MICVDDLHVPWQQPLEQRHRPALERLGQQRVVGVGDRALGQPPGLVEVELVDVDEQAHQLGDADRRVGVVELDRHLLGQVVEPAVLLQVAAQDVLERGGGEEVLLPEAELLAGGRGVGRVEDAGQRIGAVALGERAGVVAGVEGVEADRVDRVGLPQAQGVHPLRPPADDRGVVGGGLDLLRRDPDEALGGAVRLVVLDPAAEADVVGGLEPVELPGVAVLEPGLGQLDLVAVEDLLAEEAVAVADAVAVGGHADRRHALHEAGREPAEAAVAEGGVGLELGDLVEVDVEQLQRLAHRLEQAEVRDRVAHQPTDQELEAEVVDALVALEIGLAGRVHPVLDRPVAGDEDDGLEPVVGLGDVRVLADAVGQPLDDLAGEGLGLGGTRVRSRQRLQ